MLFCYCGIKSLNDDHIIANAKCLTVCDHGLTMKNLLPSLQCAPDIHEKVKCFLSILF